MGILANTMLEECWENFGRTLCRVHRPKSRGNGLVADTRVFSDLAPSVPMRALPCEGNPGMEDSAFLWLRGFLSCPETLLLWPILP